MSSHAENHGGEESPPMSPPPTYPWQKKLSTTNPPLRRPPGLTGTSGTHTPATASIETGGGGEAQPKDDGGEEVVIKFNREKFKRFTQFILRFLAALLAFVASVVIGAAKQTVEKNTIFASNLSQFQFFLAMNVIACIYAAASLAALAANSPVGTKLMLTSFTLGDVVIAVLMSVGVGCATAIDDLGKQGWDNTIKVNKFCDSIGRLCKFVDGAVAVSIISTVIFLALALLGIVELHMRTP